MIHTKSNCRSVTERGLKSRTWVSAAALGAMLLGIGGCGSPETEGSVAQNDEGLSVPANEVEALDNESLQALAKDYLFKVVDEAESLEIRNRIRRLAPESARSFGELVLSYGNATREQRTLSLAGLEYAREKGMSFLDLRPQHGREIMARAKGVALDQISLETNEPSAKPEEPGTKALAGCGIFQSSCSYTTAWNSSVGFTSCANGGCTVGSYSDYVGNSPCETGGCDTRVRFTRSSGSWVDGTTSAADCVVTYYGSLSKYSSGGYTYIGYGVGGPLYCLFFPGNPAGYFSLK